jgi:hypothetical protein
MWNDYSSGSCHRIVRVALPATGFPLVSSAGVKRNRRWASEQAVLSSAELPLDPVTEQPDTLPSAEIVMRMVVLPEAPARIADAG